MSGRCRQLRELLAEAGADAVRADIGSAEHLAGCDDCAALLRSLESVEGGLSGLAPVDAPDALVAATLAAVRSAAEPAVPVDSGPALPDAERPSGGTSSPTSRISIGPVGSGVAAAMLVAVIATAVVMLNGGVADEGAVVAVDRVDRVDRVERRPRDPNLAAIDRRGEGGAKSPASGPVVRDPVVRDPVVRDPVGQSVGGVIRGRVLDQEGLPLPGSRVVVASESGETRATYTDADGRYEIGGLAPGTYRAEGELQGFGRSAHGDVPVESGRASVVDHSLAVGMEETIRVEAGYPFVGLPSATTSQNAIDGVAQSPPPSRDLQSTLSLEPQSEEEDYAELSKDKAELRGRKQSRSKGRALERASGDGAGARPLPKADAWKNQFDFDHAGDPAEGNADDVMALRQSRQLAEQTMNVYGSGLGRDQNRSATITGGEDDDEGFLDRAALRPPTQQGRAAAQELLDGRRWNSELRYQSASGYWDNTYVPGDPTIRLLETRLSEGETIVGADGEALALDAASRQYRQPFDPPANSALAVYLHADRRGIDQRERMLLQVGLQGTSRASGLRPAMNVGVVLDLRAPPSTEVSAGMRALLTALVEARQTGDRFSVTVAGVPGGQIVVPDAFRFGSVAVAMRQLFGDPSPAGAEVETLELDAALERAVYTVAQADDPNAPLGASVVVLVTGATFGDDIEYLETGAHASAVAGIPLSVVGVGHGVDLAELGRLTLAGQGNRRLLVSPAEAGRIVDRELHSASRVVARAVRLRIRLFPGVKLIDVIHSSRLDAVRASRVREAEKAIDTRVARSLGIQADRGDDEEGIQIVIPSYYASDSHVILLDVVAERPGAIADVTVRYKDLVYLRNGVARTNLSIGPLRAEPGPLERNVLKNYVAARLSEGIRQAGLRLASGNRAGAIAELDAQVELVAGMRAEVPGWASDVELAHDLEMLAEYRRALESGVADSDVGRRQLSDSLRYAGRLKVLPRRR